MRKLLPALLCILAFAVPAQAAYDFTWEVEQHVFIAGDFAYLQFIATVTNTGDQTDMYDIHKDEILPPDWSASICVGDFCYAPFVNDVTAGPVDPGADLVIDAVINIGDLPGTGVATLTVTSQGDNGVFLTEDFTAIHDDCDLLLVDDAAKSENLWQTLPAAMTGGKVMGVWPRRDQLPTLSDLQSFGAALWLTGNTLPALVADDRSLIESYLGGGNAMLISGQDIAQDLSQAGQASWMASVLKIQYLGNGASLDLEGEDNDHLGDGLAFTLAASQTDPDLIDYAVNQSGIVASPSFRYASGPEAGVMAGATFGSPSRHVFLGFGLEGTGGDLPVLLARACEILLSTDVDPAQAPGRLTLLGNYPNPFNPKTTLSFEAPQAGKASIEVLDIHGRSIDNFEVMAQAGRNEIPFLAQDREGRSLSSGVYLYRVVVGAESAEGKLTLLK